MSETAAGRPSPGGNSMYELFMGFMTITSLIVMVMLLLVRVPEVETILASTDTLFCLFFLADFVRSVTRAPDRRTYLVGERPGRSLPTGILDLLGSIPAIGIFRVFRVFRLTRVVRILQQGGPTAIAKQFVARRSEAAIYIIAVASMLVLLLGSIAIAYVEPATADANIKSGGDAFWWAFVTITTVGYGDRYPVTEIGRFIGMLTMAVGIGIFGVLTSYLSSIFLAPAGGQDAAPVAAESSAETAVPADPVAAEVAALRAELADLRRYLERRPGGVA
ncbi:MAG: ion transporter [Chloroflexota bacterium]|nr:ion transporter [Chloroflexota bacterium]